MNHTIEDSKGRQIVFMGCHKEKNEKGYTLKEGNYTQKDMQEENALNIQEISVHDSKLNENGILEGTSATFDYKECKEKNTSRMTEHAIEMKNEIEQR